MFINEDDLTCQKRNENSNGKWNEETLNVY